MTTEFINCGGDGPDSVDRAAYKIVDNGTPFFGKSPCESCQYGSYIQGYRYSERIMFCNNFNVTGTEKAIKLPFIVAECSLFHTKDFVPISELKQTAWILKVTKRKSGGFDGGDEVSTIQFVPPDGQ